MATVEEMRQKQRELEQAIREAEAAEGLQAERVAAQAYYNQVEKLTITGETYELQDMPDLPTVSIDGIYEILEQLPAGLKVEVTVTILGLIGLDEDGDDTGTNVVPRKEGLEWKNTRLT